jgi:hypothetical protein
MGPGDFYLLAIALCVAPFIPVSRVALAVALVWLPGQFAYLIGADFGYLQLGALKVGVLTLIDMTMAIVGIGAVAGVAREKADYIVAALYGPTAAVLALQAGGYINSHDAWLVDWCWSMVRVGIVPLTADWRHIRRLAERLDTAALRLVTRGRRLNEW